MYVTVIIISSLLILKDAFCSQLCRSSLGVFPENDFNIHACGLCYNYMFPGLTYTLHPSFNSLALKTNLSYTVQPDINNTTSINSICATLSSDECERWLLCCKVSRECCTRQLKSRDANNTCPPTWDGYGCWDASAPGVTNQMSCPTFLQYPVQS
ncbi:hypothetical protein MAR_007268, partial [Mya arenaria]